MLGRLLFRGLVAWLRREVVPVSHLYSNFGKLCFEIEPGDVVLVEGRTRVSQIIKTVTQSAWTHSAIYIGRLVDIGDHDLRTRLAAQYEGDWTDQLIIESLLGHGTIIRPLTEYEGEHLRICRPMGLSAEDQLRVIEYATSQLGAEYDVRQLVDLARFFFPYALMPRRWRSSLFESSAGEATRQVCSSMMAEAYAHVDFPILPFIERRTDGSMVLYKRNPRLFTPKDFDYSPYFDVIKYPYLDRSDIAAYRALPWTETEMVYNDERDFLERIKQQRSDSGELQSPEEISDVKRNTEDGEELPEESEKEQRETPDTDTTYEEPTDNHGGQRPESSQ